MLRPVLQPGNLVAAHWRARLEDHLGAYMVEPLAARAAHFLDRAAALHGVAALCGLLRLLPERDPHEDLFEMADAIAARLGSLAGPTAPTRLWRDFDSLCSPRWASDFVSTPAGTHGHARTSLLCLAEVGTRREPRTARPGASGYCPIRVFARRESCRLGRRCRRGLSPDGVFFHAPRAVATRRRLAAARGLYIGAFSRQRERFSAFRRGPIRFSAGDAVALVDSTSTSRQTACMPSLSPTLCLGGVCRPRRGPRILGGDLWPSKACETVPID